MGRGASQKLNFFVLKIARKSPLCSYFLVRLRQRNIFFKEVPNRRFSRLIYYLGVYTGIFSFIENSDL